ncbi:hypothetical protein LGI69_001357 [Salmonella enterica]|nr:hypothetical protein [Salmonella enterica]EDW6117451.1 hypothetical protein [Salmonella enterica subsp. salamae]EGL0766797.1 hypothetical protein [Salmonella enterica subsp. enterica]EGY8943007.1 hypothetical protein [Salmonella enterica subsp. diarizonae serovar 60:r:z]EKR1421351.1 hypothetical protein [Salmonella enterica subsp. diarizonae serovar 50:z:z52]HCM1649678.1 hypothetical protein [Salmonella enterica subsp. diarizonae serovar 48:i:z35]HCM1871830.1 hypothetical protein [Salmonel
MGKKIFTQDSKKSGRWRTCLFFITGNLLIIALLIMALWVMSLFLAHS